jgi:predicted acetyltransferase
MECANENGGVAIGHGVIPSEQGNGYAAEVLRTLLEFARTQGVTGKVKPYEK